MEMLPQVILATMDYSDFESEMQGRANVTVLTEKKKLLSQDTYKEYSVFIEEIFSILKDL